MVATSGDLLIKKMPSRRFARFYIPLAAVVTPNIPEAEELTGLKLRTPKDIEEAARRIVEMGAKTVVIKGGHRQGPAVDLFFDGKNFARCNAAAHSNQEYARHRLHFFGGDRAPTSPKAKHRQEPFRWPSSTSPAPFAPALSSAPVIARCITFIGFGETEDGRLRIAMRSVDSHLTSTIE